MQVRFVEIDVFNAEAGDAETVVQFALQDMTGKRFKFRQLGFVDFVTRAVNLVKPPFVVTDTDQLIGTWFELEESTKY